MRVCDVIRFKWLLQPLGATVHGPQIPQEGCRGIPVPQVAQGGSDELGQLRGTDDVAGAVQAMPGQHRAPPALAVLTLVLHLDGPG